MVLCSFKFLLMSVEVMIVRCFFHKRQFQYHYIETDIKNTVISMEATTKVEGRAKLIRRVVCWQEAALSAVGQARLLMSQKLRQFAALLDACARPQPGAALVTPADLHGFWDMVFMQVSRPTLYVLCVPYSDMSLLLSFLTNGASDEDHDHSGRDGYVGNELQILIIRQKKMEPMDELVRALFMIKTIKGYHQVDISLQLPMG